MAQLYLQNKDKKVIKAGDFVKFYTGSRKAFIYTLIGDANIIGTSAESIYPGKWGYINTLNTPTLIADGTYTIGLGLSTDGVIVVKDGVIISLTEAT